MQHRGAFNCWTHNEVLVWFSSRRNEKPPHEVQIRSSWAKTMVEALFQMTCCVWYFTSAVFDEGGSHLCAFTESGNQYDRPSGPAVKLQYFID